MGTEGPHKGVSTVVRSCRGKIRKAPRRARHAGGTYSNVYVFEFPAKRGSLQSDTPPGNSCGVVAAGIPNLPTTRQPAHFTKAIPFRKPTCHFSAAKPPINTKIHM